MGLLKHAFNNLTENFAVDTLKMVNRAGNAIIQTSLHGGTNTQAFLAAGKSLYRSFTSDYINKSTKAAYLVGGLAMKKVADHATAEMMGKRHIY